MSVFDDLESLFSHPGVLGFNPLVNDLRAAISAQAGYPPRNIIKTSDDSWIIEVAVAGFRPDELSVVVENSHLIISGAHDDSDVANDVKSEYIHQGLAKRNFRFITRLGEHVKVSDEYPPFIQNGMLLVNLKREIPEEEKPKSYAITSVDHAGRNIPELEDPEA